MTEKWCGLCQRRHSYQAYEAPRYETAGDFWWALITWTLVIAAYVSAAFWLASR